MELEGITKGARVAIEKKIEEEGYRRDRLYRERERL